ncbi:hypothetical protein C8R45DRAFT_599235 [Mycena sanguinolenta]|nr:hypothetical protein C8R45DRAFT_599235 [Mycena sanguinolenta]
MRPAKKGRGESESERGIGFGSKPRVRPGSRTSNVTIFSTTMRTPTVGRRVSILSTPSPDARYRTRKQRSEYTSTGMIEEGRERSDSDAAVEKRQDSEENLDLNLKESNGFRSKPRVRPGLRAASFIITVFSITTSTPNREPAPLRPRVFIHPAPQPDARYRIRKQRPEYTSIDMIEGREKDLTQMRPAKKAGLGRGESESEFERGQGLESAPQPSSGEFYYHRLQHYDEYAGTPSVPDSIHPSPAA